ncbi:MAG: amino acid permease [Flavobacteriales bacterium]|nr:amino acid permease [Flavobacteriales bacterium]
MEKSNPQLIRAFGLFTAVLFVMGSIIGSGVFKKIAPMSAELGSAGLILGAWAAAGLITLLGALSNAEVGGLIAEPGGQFVYFRHMYGLPFAFFYGWATLAVIQSATAAGVAYVFAESLNALVLLPRLPQNVEALDLGGVFQPFANSGVKGCTIALLLILTAINYRGVKLGGWVLKIFASTVIVCIFLIAALCLAKGKGHPLTDFRFLPSSKEASQAGLFASFFTAMLSAFWAYEGWITVTYLGGEIRNPHRNIPLALTFGTLGVIAVYLMINAAYLYAEPPSFFQAVNARENQIAAVEVVRSLIGDRGAVIVIVLILLSTFSCTNTTFMGAPRVYFAMAREGLFPAIFGLVHPRYRTPHVAVLIQGVWSSVLVLSGTFDQLTDMLVFAAFIFYGMGALGVFVLRRKMPDAPRPYKVIGYPVVPLAFVLFCATLVFISILERPREAAIGMALIASGIPVYAYYFRKRKSQIKLKISDSQ